MKFPQPVPSLALMVAMVVGQLASEPVAPGRTSVVSVVVVVAPTVVVGVAPPPPMGAAVAGPQPCCPGPQVTRVGWAQARVAATRSTLASARIEDGEGARRAGRHVGAVGTGRRPQDRDGRRGGGAIDRHGARADGGPVGAVTGDLDLDGGGAGGADRREERRGAASSI